MNVSALNFLLARSQNTPGYANSKLHQSWCIESESGKRQCLLLKHLKLSKLCDPMILFPRPPSRLWKEPAQYEVMRIGLCPFQGEIPSVHV